MNDAILSCREVSIKFLNCGSDLGFTAWHLTIRNGQRQEPHSFFSCITRLILKIQILFFIGSEQRENSIDSGLPPGGDFVLEPVPAARASGQSQFTGPRASGPIEFRRHASIIPFG